MKPIVNDIATQYDLSVKAVKYNRSNYYLETGKGIYLLRKVNIPKDQIVFEYEANRKLLNRGFQHLEKLYLTKRQSPYVHHQDKTYVLQSYRALEDIDFKDEEDLKHIIEVLAHFHRLAKHIDLPGKKVEKVVMKDVGEYFKKRTIECRKMKNNMANVSQKSKFEIMFNEGYEEYETLQRRALELLDDRISKQLITTAKEHKTLVHNEYTYHAIGKTNTSQYIISHLDTCGYNIQVLDIVNVLTKVMQKNNWNIDLLVKLVETYKGINNLSDDEYQALKAMLIFPEKFTSVCHKYSNSKRRNNYSMFEMKWEHMLEYKDAQIKAALAIEKYL